MLEETRHVQVDKSLEITHLTPALYSRLSILAVNRRASREELQRKLGVSKSQTYYTMGKLKCLGLIERSYQTPVNLRVVSIELTPAGEAALHAPAPVGRKEVSPAVAEVLEILRNGEQGLLTAEQLALSLKSAEVEAVVSLVRGKPFQRHNLYDSLRRGELRPLEKRGNGYLYALATVLDFIGDKQREHSAIFKKPVISPALMEVLSLLRAGEQDKLTSEQLALPLARSEVREVLSCISGEPFPERRLHDLIGRRILLPLPSRRRGSGYRLHYSLETVLDLIEKLKAPTNEITFELGEVLEVLRTEGPDHLTQKQLDLPLHTAEVVVLATYLLGKPFPQQRIYDLCRRKYNRLQAIGPRRGQGYRLLYRVGDVLKALESSR